LKAEWKKTRIAGAIEAPNDPVPEGHLIKKTSTMMRGDGTTAVQWISAAADEKRREDAMRAAWKAHAAEYSGLAGTAPVPTSERVDLLTVYPLGDPHIGMLAWAPEAGAHFDLKIAQRELVRCVNYLVDCSPPSANAIVCNLGDFLHAQDDRAETPGHGNRLEVEGRYAKVLQTGHDILRAIVDAALRKHAHVTVRNLPGNHDPRVAAELYMWLQAIYALEPRATIAEPFAAQQYDRHGCVLLGWHHGDRAKPNELPAIMATDRHEDWGQTTERVWHTGHVHHLSKKESPGCVVETHRTMAAKDAYHAGRYRSGQSLQSITYHSEYGEESRSTCNIARVKALIERGARG
jgi:hypothetical protein